MKSPARVFAAIALAVVLGASACAKKKPAPPPAASAATAGSDAAETTSAASPSAPAKSRQPKPLTEEEIFARKSVAELNDEKPLGDAFFDLDSQQIRDDARAALQKDADWLKKWPSTKVLVSGHGDSRGSAEYNLALGERRASAVRDYLVSLGVADRPHRDRQQGQGSAVLHGGKRVLLAAEPRRPLRDYREVKRGNSQLHNSATPD